MSGWRRPRGARGCLAASTLFQCPAQISTLRQIHRDAIEKWLEAVRNGESPSQTERLKRAIASTMEDLLEHRKQHGC